MTKYYAVGTLVAWNALTIDEQNFYDGNHFLNLYDAIQALPVTPTSNYEIKNISDVDSNLGVSTPVSFNGFKLSLNGNGYKINLYADGYGITCWFSNDEFELCNYDFVSKVDKTASFQSVILVRNHSVGLISIYDNTFNLNNKSDNTIFLYEYDGDHLNIYNNEAFNSNSGASYGGVRCNISGKVYFENNVFYNVKYSLYRVTALNTFCKNNYFGCSDTSIKDGTITDQGKNFTSDNSTEVPLDFRNLSPDDAFVNPSNGDFTPKPIMKQGIAPTIDGHTHYKNGVLIRPPYYIGAIGKKKRINRNRKRRLRMMMED